MDFVRSYFGTISCFLNNSRFGDKFKPTLNIEPSDTFEDELRITEAGFDLVLYHAPG